MWAAMITRLCLLSALLTVNVCGGEGKREFGKRRTPRDAGCNDYQFLCKFGSQCINATLVCDGQPDCTDKSDESFTLCSQQLYGCPKFAFRCSYGACVDADAKCNGVYDCADYSDELLKECPGVTSQPEENLCQELEFACVDGTQCVPGHTMCDGVVDCNDGSDETVTECSQIECPPFTFRCAYGACVDGDAPCDGSPNCRDGSDEIAPQCSFERPAPTPFWISATTQPSNVPVFFDNKTTPTRPTPSIPTRTKKPTTPPNTVFRPCSLPTPPGNGTYTSSVCEHEPGNAACSRAIGAPVPSGLLLHFSCAEGFTLRGNADVVCSSGIWYPNIPKCSDECEPLLSKKLQITCISKGKQLLPCDKPVPGNATASFRCETWHMKVAEPGYSQIVCRSGSWDRPLVDDFCQPACGKALSDFAQPVVLHGKQTQYGQFPWHVGIYERNNGTGTFEQTCGGSLVSPKLVVSAAHCFYFEKSGFRQIFKKEESRFRVAVGKYYRNLNAEEDTFEKIHEVAKVEAPSDYRGQFSLYLGDIAFVLLKTQVEYSYAVRPVCLDIGKFNFEQDQLVSGAMGKVVGWGLTADRQSSNTLLLAEMPFVPRDECRQTISSSLFLYVTEDKICAGNRTSLVNVCPGDSGGGLVFEDVATKTHYLRGVVSLGTKGCSGQEYALFTRVSVHNDDLSRHLDAHE